MSGTGGTPSQRFDFGDPAPEEQLLWFLVNRARADPTAEGQWLSTLNEPLVQDGIKAFGVDVNQLRTDFAGYKPKSPVAWDAGLATAAAREATDQGQHRTQQHRGSDGSTPASRARDASVKATLLVENLSSYAHSPIYAHAAFQIDWGGKAPTGVENWPRPGHRFAIMNVASGSPANVVGMKWLPVKPGDDNFGPDVVVQEFARIQATFIVGTVWVDVNGNGALDPGEGLGQVDVRPDRGQWFATSLQGGAFEIPVSEQTNYTITVSATGYTTKSLTVGVAGENVLVNIQLAK